MNPPSQRSESAPSTERETGGGRWALAAVAFILPLSLFVLTACPSVFVGDSGEMVTISYELGIPQPTGFPLYCLLGKLFCLLPLGTIAWRVNLLSAVATAGTSLSIYLILSRRTGGRLDPAFALIGALSHATGMVVWSQATIARTYPLTQALLAWEVALALIVAERPGQRSFLGLALLSGFSMGTHLLSILIVPILIVLAARETWTRRVIALGLTTLGLSLYAYLPIRFQATSYNVGGNVSSVIRLKAYLTQERYRTKQFSRTPANVRAFWKTVGSALVTEHPWSPALLLVLTYGLARSLRPTGSQASPCPSPMTGFLVLGVAFNLFIMLAYGDNKDVPFLPRYFLFVAFAQSILFTAGLDCLDLAMGRRFTTSLIALGLFLVGWSLATNSRSCNLGRTIYPSLYASRLLETLPENSVLFVQGDAPTLMCDYMQHCERRRTDVRIGGPEQYEIIKMGVSGSLRVFCNFIPREMLARREAVHAGFCWELTPKDRPPTATIRSRQDLEALRAKVWSGFSVDALCTDPALADYEAAALAGEILFHRGLDLLEEGRPLAARDALDKAVAASPRNRLIYYSAAKVHADLGWKASARDLVDRGLRVDLDFADQDEDYRRMRYRSAGLASMVDGAETARETK